MRRNERLFPILAAAFAATAVGLQVRSNAKHAGELSPPAIRFCKLPPGETAISINKTAAIARRRAMDVRLAKLESHIRMSSSDSQRKAACERLASELQIQKSTMSRSESVALSEEAKERDQMTLDPQLRHNALRTR